MKYERIDQWWNDRDVNLIKFLEDGRVFALHGWNGQEYNECWECTGEGYIASSKETYTLTPIHQGVGEPDEDGDYAEYEIIGFIVN